MDPSTLVSKVGIFHFVSAKILNYSPRCPHKKLANANLSKLTEILWTSRNGHFREWKAQEMKALAQNSFGIAVCGGAYSALILVMLEQIHALQEKCSVWEAQIVALPRQFDTTLTTISGIGPILTAVILSEAGDISRFSSADKLAAYIGVDPAVNQSHVSF